jgi:hypothetical protein
MRLASCGKRLWQAERLPHHASQSVDPWWWRRRFRLRIGPSKACFRNLLGLLLAIGVAATAQAVRDPVQLRVAVAGDTLSYTVVNQLPYKIVQVDIYTQFTSGGFEHLGCALSATVDSAEAEIRLPGACRLPLDPKTGKPINYSSRIVQVQFENGLTWYPGKRSPN